MRPVLLFALLLLCSVSIAQKPAKISIKYISQDEVKRLDGLKDQDFGLIFYKDKSLSKYCTSESEVNTFVSTVNFSLMVQKSVATDVIYIVSATGQEPGYILTWDGNTQQYIH